MGFSVPVTVLHRGNHLSGLGMLGADIPVAAWKAGTQIHYHNTGMLHNSFSGYSDSAVQQAYANSGLFIPTTVRFSSSPNFLGLTSDIDLWGTLPVDVNQADAQNVIEGLIKNFYVSSPGTATYSPAPNATQTVNASGQVTSSTGSSGVQVTASSYGIESVLGYSADESSDFDVIYTDGSSGIFDAEGAYYSGNRDGISEVGQLYDNSETLIGYFALLNDGTELYFDTNGNYTDSNVDYSASTGTQVVKTTNAPPPQPKTGIDWNKIASNFGLSSFAAGLGIGGGTALILAGGALYVFFNGLPTGRRR